MRRFVIVAACALVAASLCFSGETVKLPAPQKAGGPALFKAIDNRASAPQAGFPSGALSREDVSTLLWAASGLNRDGEKWTVPMAMGVPPYCTVYYVDKGGAYRYVWKDHTMVKVAEGTNMKFTVTQDFAKAAPALIFVVESGEEKAKIRNVSWKIKNEYTVLLAGMMGQNIYLAAQGVGVGARLVYSIDHGEVSKLLGLAKDDKPFYAIVLGK